MNFLKALKNTGADKKSTLKQLMTPWGEELLKEKNVPLTEYPRPQMIRGNYACLNGFWEYAFTKSPDKPNVFEGLILVPFSPESVLSGVQRQLRPDEYLWYRKETEIHIEEGKRLLLHFGAADQFASCYVNGKLCKAHRGGYTPFTADITDFIREGLNELSVCVMDFSDTADETRGKQKTDRGGMFYTAQSGIWQTVWMEWVPKRFISAYYAEADIDNEEVHIFVRTAGTAAEGVLKLILDDGTTAETACEGAYTDFVLKRKNPTLWTPETPHLYRGELVLQTGDAIDRVRIYFAMREVSVEKDEKGTPRFCLNHKPYFIQGLLDQGYWPDGLYTAPSEEAMRFDIETAKAHGFNLLRKHMKIEPARWYALCDELGMLVMQDMPCGGGKLHSLFVTILPTVFPGMYDHISDCRHRRWFARESKDAMRQFERECEEMIEALRTFPCIIAWCPFNEGWGQFDSDRIAKEIKARDRSRLVDAASGWFDQKSGDFRSRHIYFRKLGSVNADKADPRAYIISEYGGYVYRVEGHVCLDHSYGYSMKKSLGELNFSLRELVRKELKPLMAQGLCGAIYTQISDVEEEMNGLMTYDRKVIKIEKDVFRI